MKIYIYDEQRVYSRSEDVVDIYAQVPKNSVTEAPPKTSGDQVAHWMGNRWEILDKRPPLPISPPVPPEPEPEAYPQFTPLEMLDLFTEPEQLAVVGATMSVPAVKLWYDRLLAASFVTYEDPRTEGGLQALVDAGLLDPGRKADIVAAMQPQTEIT